MHNPAHPGLVLKEWIPEDVTVAEAALQLGVARATLSKILNQKAGVSAEMALRLSKWLGTTPELWADIQSAWNLWEASRLQSQQAGESEVKAGRFINGCRLTVCE